MCTVWSSADWKTPGTIKDVQRSVPPNSHPTCVTKMLNWIFFSSSGETRSLETPIGPRIYSSIRVESVTKKRS